MLPLLLSSAVLATSCAAPTPQQASPSTAKIVARDLFPEPKSGISIRVEPGSEMKLDQLLAEFTKATGLHFVVGREIATILRSTPTGLMDSVEIPKEQVYPVVESLLFQNGILLAVLTDREPHLLAVGSLAQAHSLSTFWSAAVFVPSDEVAEFARHPAIMVTTVINLSSTDVRTLSNSMRTMFTDANTQQIIPIGNSNSLIVTGSGSVVAGMVSMLKRIDDEARREIEAAAKKAQDRPAPPVPVEPPR